jgi:hypothetical protein
LTVEKHLSSRHRLAILQAADNYRKWYSLEDQRVCVLCDKAITGRQIEIRRDQRGRFMLHCPTPGCPSTAQDWFYHGSACSRPSGVGVRSVEADLRNL